MGQVRVGRSCTALCCCLCVFFLPFFRSLFPSFFLFLMGKRERTSAQFRGLVKFEISATSMLSKIFGRIVQLDPKRARIKRSHGCNTQTNICLNKRKKKKHYSLNQGSRHYRTAVNMALTISAFAQAQLTSTNFTLIKLDRRKSFQLLRRGERNYR